MRVAIIDIGSNAIRAAVYSDNTLGAFEIFNEKFRNDISSLLDRNCIHTNHPTYNKFSYFLNIFKKMNVTIISCVATEILRSNPRSQEFVDEIRKRFNLEVRILSGEEEARLAAAGLVSSSTNLTGIAVDLGGGSLELAEIKDGEILQVRSMPLGTKALDTEDKQSADYVVSYLQEECLFKECTNLYLIGGALRLLGRCYMDYSNNIIKNLHHLSIPSDKFGHFLSGLYSIQKFNTFIRQYKINNNAVFVLQALINYLRPTHLIISTYGLKEGVRFNLLPSHEKKRDIIIDKCHNIAKNYISEMDIERYVQLFLSIMSVCPTVEEEKLLRLGLILSQTTVNIEKNYKAEWILNFILTVDISFDQLQRASLIIALSGAFGYKHPVIPKGIWKLLSKRESTFAQAIGAFIKISMMLDGLVLTSPSFSINEKNDFLEIEVNNIIPKNIFDKICEQLKILGIARKIWINEKSQTQNIVST